MISSIQVFHAGPVAWLARPFQFLDGCLALTRFGEDFPVPGQPDANAGMRTDLPQDIGQEHFTRAGK